MKIFLDFDGVIFNTELFKKQLIKIFFKNGVPKEIFKKSYRNSKGKNLPYSVAKHLKFLAKNEKINSKKISADLKKLLNNLKQYVFGEARIFLKHFSKNDLYLISYGDLNFQKQKIKGAKVSKFFKRVIVTAADKGKIIEKIAKKDKFKKGETIIFIDDKPGHIKEVKRKNIITFQIIRSNLKIPQIADFNVRNFKTIEKFIKKIYH